MAVVFQRHSREIKGEAGLESPFGACAADARAAPGSARAKGSIRCTRPRSNTSALAPVIPEIEAQIGANLTCTVADRGYRGHDAPSDYKVRVCVLGQRHRVIETIKRELRRRFAIDQAIGRVRPSTRRAAIRSRVGTATATTPSSPPLGTASAGPDAASISRGRSVLKAHPLDDFPRRRINRLVESTRLAGGFPAMREIQASEAKTHVPQLLDDVERGETVVITRHGRAIARIVPEAHLRQAEVDRAIASIKALRQRTGKITVDALVSAKHEGHKY